MANKKTKTKTQTGWLRFGRSGDTIDGRVISDQDILESAEGYDPEFYTSLIWYEHRRGFNLGKVVAIRAEKNDEGGLDLFGQLQPNDYYKMLNSDEQKLFLSMEFRRNFRKTGKTYLGGLGATDEPASVATSEVRFSRVDDKDALLSEFIESTTHHFNNEHDNDQENVPGWFTRILYNLKPDEDMDTKKLKALEESFTKLQTDFAAYTAKPAADDDAGSDEGAPTADDKFTKLSEQVIALASQLTAIESKIADNGDTDETLKLSQLQTAFDELSTKFNAALEENPGTNAGEETGGEDLNGCL